MNKTNQMRLSFSSRPENESFARVAVSAFLVQLNPTLEEINDVTTAVSEAVPTARVHGYPRGADGEIRLAVKLLPDDCAAEILVSDDGVGIENVEQAMQPFYTTQPEMERSGMGFSVMQSFMDELRVESAPGEGTRVFMKKQFEG